MIIFALTSQASLHGGESERDARTAAVGSCMPGQGRDLHAKYAARKFPIIFFTSELCSVGSYFSRTIKPDGKQHSE